MTFWRSLAFSFLAACIGYFGFIVTAFGGGALVNNHELNAVHMTIVNLSIYIIPASALVSIVMIWHAHKKKLSSTHYCWTGLPALLIGLYFAYAFIFFEA